VLRATVAAVKSTKLCAIMWSWFGLANSAAGAALPDGGGFGTWRARYDDTMLDWAPR